jgi:hypothetical protein
MARNLARLDRYLLPPPRGDEFGRRNPQLAGLLWRHASKFGVVRLGGEMMFARQHVTFGNVLANEEYLQAALRHYRHALKITEDNWQGKGRDADFVFPAEPDYTGGHGEPMGDTRENTEDELLRAARNVPPGKRDIAIRLLKQLAAGEVTAPAKPRLKWPNDAKPDETPAHFASRAGYVHRGEISSEDRALSVKLSNWLRTHDWPDDVVPYIPTLPQWNKQQATKLPELRREVRRKLDDDAREVHRLEAVVTRQRRNGERIPAM